MSIIDTHAHIYLDEMDDDREKMLNRAESEGVNKILMPAVDSTTHHRMFNLEKLHPASCFSMMGLHPCSVKENFREELQLAASLLSKRKFIGVGEIGLDFYWDLTFKEQQLEAFHEQLGWALKYDVPVSIHSRNATDECIDVVTQNQNGKLKGVFHCFSGTEEQAVKIIDQGFYLGIGGVVTFKNAGLDRVIEKISLEHIVLETDTPYLAPVPFRGKRNEPSYLKYIVSKISTIKNCSAEEVTLMTTSNAEKLFKII